MPDKKLIQKKLEEILKQLRHLALLCKLKDEELFGKEANFYFAERVMERMLGAAIDINMHIVADLMQEVPENYFTSFIMLGKAGVIPNDFAKKIAPSTSLRNILVHEYQNLDLEKFKKSLKYGLKYYQLYAEYIQKFLKTF